jgi:SAM-dependent methyltransferase
MIAADHAREAYDAMAPAYDAFTAHHRYDLWADALEALALAAGLRGRRLLDVACGTGKSFEPFLARGYEVTACDVSPGMLAVATARAGERARLLEADMRALPRLGEFDLVCVLDDAVNYLDTPGELVATLCGVADNLHPDGVLLFDANTLLPYRSFFAEPLIVHDGERLLVWEGRASAHFAPGDACSAELHTFTPEPDGRWAHALSVHRQRHHPEPVVRAALADAGFPWVEVHGMHVDGTATPGLDEDADTKALYVARLSAPQRGEGR